MSAAFLVRNGRLLDPAQGLDLTGDLLVREGRVARVGTHLDAEGDPVLDASGLWVLPGFVDTNVHFRVPGEPGRETLASGTAAAAAGGYSRVVCMPDTRPPLDDRIRVEWLRMRGEREGMIPVEVAGTLTVGGDGRSLTDPWQLREAGAVALTDDPRSIPEASLMRRTLENARAAGLPVLIHAEDAGLAAGGAMHEGAASQASGMPASPWTAEAVVVARDLLLAEAAGARIHFLHLSTGAAVALIRWAKARGVRVTCEVTPHHLLFTDEDVARSGFAPDWKTTPPLRGARDREMLREALADGTVDWVATNHVPRGAAEKSHPFPEAAAGVAGLETAAAAVFDALVPDVLSPLRFVEVFSTAPARGFGFEGGTLSAGAPADLTFFDPNAVWTVDPASLQTRSAGTPFAGRRLRGRVVRTVVGGRTVFELGRQPEVNRR